jgi:hypothetical protein
MNSELERIRKEAIMAKFKLLSRYFYEETEKTTKILNEDSRDLPIPSRSANQSATTFGNFTSCCVWVWNLVSHREVEPTVSLCETKVLRGRFGPKREEVTGDWRKLHSEDLHNLHSSSDIVRVIILRIMR